MPVAGLATCIKSSNTSTRSSAAWLPAFLSRPRSQDGRLSKEEFQAGMGELGIQLPPDQVEKEFRAMDLDHGGMVLFTEFCAYVRKRVQPDHNPAFDADIVRHAY